MWETRTRATKYFLNFWKVFHNVPGSPSRLRVCEFDDNSSLSSLLKCFLITGYIIIACKNERYSIPINLQSRITFGYHSTNVWSIVWIKDASISRLKLSCSVKGEGPPGRAGAQTGGGRRRSHDAGAATLFRRLIDGKLRIYPALCSSRDFALYSLQLVRPFTSPTTDVSAYHPSLPFEEQQLEPALVFPCAVKILSSILLSRKKGAAYSRTSLFC